MPKVSELLQQRGEAYDKFKALADKPALNDNERQQYESLRGEVISLDDRIKRAREDQELAARTAQPVAGQHIGEVFQRDVRGHWRVPASPENDPYVNDNVARTVARSHGYIEGSARSMVIGGMIRMLARAEGSLTQARLLATEECGESHPITRALITSAGSAGGFIVPPDYVNEIIELLRPAAVVRAAGPRVIPMPRGTMRLPGQASAASASYGAEDTRINTSQQALNSITATYKKLTALVPVSNDMMRYSDPAVDAFVRDDLVRVVALREDLAFLIGDGTQDTPRGMLSFANGWVQRQGGTGGTWSATADSVYAVNGTPGDPTIGQNGGNFVTANASFTLDTVAVEFGAAINALDTANVPENRRVWFWHPRTKNYLFNLLNSLGVYVYRDEMRLGTFLGYPFKNTTQMPINLWDPTGTHKDCSLVLLTEMAEDMILDSMTLELAVSRKGTYVDAGCNTVSAFQNDETLIRAIAEHDHQMRHDAAVAVIQGARYAPQAS